MSEPVFDNQTDDAVAVKDKVASVDVSVSNNGVHTSDLKLGR